MVTKYDPAYHQSRYHRVIKPQIAARLAAGLCYFCKSLAIAGQTRCQRHHDKALIEQRVRGAKYNLKAKEAVYNHYGRHCACCAESNPHFLTMDHINNDGAEHRKQVGMTNFYGWLYRNNFPEGFQTLCRNCNWGKYSNAGTCPHQTEG